MNYYNTFIEVAEDCPVAAAAVPAPKGAKRTLPVLQYAMVADHPYTYTQDDVLFETYAEHKGIPAADRPAEREKFFAQDQPCLRTSPLAKRYGWGIHCDANGKIALIARESQAYRQLADDPRLKHLKAMRSKRA